MKDIEDAIPFTLPEGWAWCRLPNISASIFAGGDRPIIYEKTKSDKCNIPIYSNGIENNGLYGFTDKSVVNVSSLTVSARGTIGFSCIRNEPFVPIIRLITIIPFIECINLVFLKFSFDALFSFSEGSNIPQLTVPTVKQFLLPLPPLAEQKRIVAKIEAIFTQIDVLEQNKADLQTAVKQAKSKILDLAIRGKLVPQDPDDEPASVMLEKLRAEKEAKIVAGEIKRGKNDSYIYRNPTDNCYYQKYADGCEENISDEIPFDVPDGWAWCRLGEIADIARGGSPRPIEYFITDKENGINWIKIGDTTPEDKYIISAKEKIKPEGRKHSRFVHAGDFLLTNSMSFGRPYILKIDGCIHDGWLVFADIINSLLKEFLYYALSSQYIYNSFSLVAAGSTVKNLKADTVKQVLFPFPPLAEQKRIVVKIEELFAQLDFITAVPTE